MCGIAGIWGDAAPKRLQAMADRLRHRGPDDEAIWIHPRHDLGFAHRRLSIIDLKGGRQPIESEDGRVVTMLNGEIYNYRELREELIAGGHRFKTHSDTEVIVHLFEDHGTGFVSHLRGMFAIVIWDEGQRLLVLVRDRAGKKPLYFSEIDGDFLFASEIKGVLAASRRPLAVDEQSLADYLAWGTIHAPATIYREVRSVCPGELLVVRRGRVVTRERYWRQRMIPKVRVSPAEAVEQVDGLVREAVRLRLRSDVPVGAFLSGGVDSGIVTAMAAKECAGTLTTITVGFEDGAFDERPAARLVADRYATDHHELLLRTDVAADLPAITAAYDQPFADSSAIPSYCVARATRPLVKVVLSGDGGDELFGGYRRYIAGRVNQLLCWADGPICRPVWTLIGRLLPVPRSYRSAYAFAHRLARGMAMEPVSRYLTWAVDVFDEDRLRLLCGVERRDSPRPRWLDRTQRSDRLARRALQAFDACGPIDRMMGADFAAILPHDLLVKMDIACMAHGLEARSPLLDTNLIDVVSRYPERIKLPGFSTKPILRALSSRYVPEVVRTAPKRGFEVPIVRWLRGDLRDLCQDVVLSRDGLLASLFSRPALEKLVGPASSRSRNGLDPARWGRCVWTLLMLGMWDRVVNRSVGYG